MAVEVLVSSRAEARLPSLLSHLALAQAGVCLTVAESTFLPEMPFVLVIYLILVWLSYRVAGRWTLPAWGANVLGVCIATGAAVWVGARLNQSESLDWLRDVPLTVAVIPYLGPVLMALLLVRLYRPRMSGDFWLVQGVGLLQVALGCVLDSGGVFGSLVFVWLVLALAALAVHERQRETTRAAGATSSGRGGRLAILGAWGWFGLCWATAVMALAWPIFLLTPRVDGPEWDPLLRFGVRRPNRQTSARMGFSDDIDLMRSSTLEFDDSTAFTVRLTDDVGRPLSSLHSEQRWRGIVLDRYEDGVWRTDLNWPSGAPRAHASSKPYNAGSQSIALEFRVPSRTGGLFLAEPTLLGSEPGVLPVRPSARGRTWQTPIFYEAGGTVVPLNYLTSQEYLYEQIIPVGVSRDRSPEVRLREPYKLKLLRCRIPGLSVWTRERLIKLVQSGGPAFSELNAFVADPLLRQASLPPCHWESAARLLSNYLSTSGDFSYTLKNRREDPNIDPIMDFLQNVQQGSCERYAAALTMMLRSQGIPARIIKGYRGGDYQGDGVYRIKQFHAHAWTEALVQRSGAGPMQLEWLSLDPTPDNGNDPDGTQSALARWWRQQQLSGQVLWQELVVGYNTSQQADLWEELATGRLLVRLAPWLACAGLCAVLYLLRRRHQRRKPGQPGIAGLVETTSAILTRRLYLTRQRGQTLRDLAEEAGALLSAREATQDLAGVPAAVFEAYYRHRYGRQVLDHEELARLTARVATLQTRLLHS